MLSQLFCQKPAASYPAGSIPLGSLVGTIVLEVTPLPPPTPQLGGGGGTRTSSIPDFYPRSFYRVNGHAADLVITDEDEELLAICAAAAAALGSD